jgi:Predicted ATPase
LVVDAEVQPKDLFDDQENLGFARTLSRLTEMTSTDWVAQHMDK